jgi:hypothetical protein
VIGNGEVSDGAFDLEVEGTWFFSRKHGGSTRAIAGLKLVEFIPPKHPAALEAESEAAPAEKE